MSDPDYTDTPEENPLDKLHFDSNLMDTEAVSVTAAIQRLQQSPERTGHAAKALAHLEDMLKRSESIKERLQKIVGL